MKVLHILDHTLPVGSGYSFRSHYILKWQGYSGMDSAGLSSPLYNTKDHDSLIDGIRYFRCNGVFSSAIMKKAGFVFSLKRKIEELSLKERFQILHAHSPSLCGICGLMARRNLKIPLVYEVRALWEDAAVDQGKIRQSSFKYRCYRMLENIVLKRADAVVTICDGLKKELMSRGLREDRIFVVPNGIDLERFNRKKSDSSCRLKKKLKIGDERVVGFIGSFYSFEGLDCLIEAVAGLEKVKLVLVGGGEVFEKLKQLSRRLKADSRIIFVGRVSHDEVFKYYDLMDVMVYPRRSRRITETVTPLKPLEAMALGKPVIGSDVGGIKELLSGKEGVAGLLFRSGSVEDLRKKIKDMLEDEVLRKSLILKGLSVVRSREWKILVKRYLKIYKIAEQNFLKQGM